MTVWLGIDAGISGACAFIGENGLGAKVFPIPLRDHEGQDEVDGEALAELLEEYRPRLVCLEKVQGFGGCSSAFKLGQSVGSVITTTLAGRFRLERVSPQKWQRSMLPEIHGRDALKRASVSKAKALFPTVCFAKEGRTKPDDIADALLIAAYARECWP